MNNLMLALRLIHIASAIFWVGGAFIMVYFVAPTVRATGEAGQKFMGHLVTQARVTTAITVAALLTILAGLSLYWIDSDGFTSGWMKSAAGIGFTIGGLAGLSALVFGIVFGKNITALGTLFASLQGKPSPEQMIQLQSIQKNMGVIGPLHVISQVVAVLCMATARYWHF
jgi:uncharacterized membrane protein